MLRHDPGRLALEFRDHQGEPLSPSFGARLGADEISVPPGAGVMAAALLKIHPAFEPRRRNPKFEKRIGR
jgi:hypothetical protein